MRKIRFIYFFILFTTVSCSIKEPFESIVVTERIIDFHEDSTVKSKKIFLDVNDTLNYNLVEYYKNGQIKRTGPIKDSIVYGDWSFYHENGNIKMKGSFIIDDSLNNGNWSYSYWLPLRDEEGEIMEEGFYMCSVDYAQREKNNIHVCKDGEWEYFFENGQLEAKGTYENGWSSGGWMNYNSDGQLILESNFKNKKPFGEWKYSYPNGQVMKFIEHTDTSELLLQAFDSIGTKKVIDGNGTFEEPQKNDSLKTVKISYLNGVRHGMYREYNRQGVLEEKGLYKNGHRHGQWLTFHNKDLVQYERNYKNGVAHGKFYNYSSDGKRTMIRYFVNGLEHGVTRHIDGWTRKTTLIEPWIMGNRHGVRKYFDSEGVQTGEDYFYEGDMIGKSEYKEGELIEQRIFEGDEDKFKKLSH